MVYSRHGGPDLRVLDPRTGEARSSGIAPEGGPSAGPSSFGRHLADKEEVMKVWNKPAVREQEVGLEVTSYMPAEIDII